MTISVMKQVTNFGQIFLSGLKLSQISVVSSEVSWEASSKSGCSYLLQMNSRPHDTG